MGKRGRQIPKAGIRLTPRKLIPPFSFVYSCPPLKAAVERVVASFHFNAFVSRILPCSAGEHSSHNDNDVSSGVVAS